MSNRVIRPLPTDQVNLNSQESMHSATASFDDKPRKQLEDPLLSSVAPLEDNTRFAIKLAKEATMGKDKPSPENQTPETSQRYLIAILLLNLMVCFGMNYVYDAPQALEDPLIRGLKIDTLKISMMYSLYSLPNLVLTPVVGIAISRLGCHNACLVYTSIVFFGSLVTFFGVYQSSFVYIVFGRSLIGLGGEGARIVQMTINELWFFGYFLSTSVAWGEIMECLAGYLGNVMHPELLVQTRSLPTPFFAMALVCFFSWAISLIYYFQHIKHHKKLENRARELEEESESEEEESSYSVSHVTVNNDQHKDIVNRSFQEHKRITTHHQSLVPEHSIAGSVKIRPEIVLGIIEEEEHSKIKHKPQIFFGLSSIKYYSGMYWLLCVFAICSMNSYHQSMSLATEIIQNRFMYKFEDANEFTIIPDIAFIAGAPFLSRWIEERGAKPMFLVGASLCFLISFVSMYCLPADRTLLLIPILSLIGIGYAVLTCALFSSVALSVPKAGVGMAFSILTLIENLGNTLLPLLFGKLAAPRNVAAYNDCLLSLIILALASTALSIALVVYDLKTTRILALPENSVTVRKIRHRMDSLYLEMSIRDSQLSSQVKSVKTLNRRAMPKVVSIKL